MKEFRERNISFAFDHTWICDKWDDCATYRSGIAILQGTQAVDFLGIHDESVYLIEVKDFRGYRIESKNVGDKSTKTALGGGDVHYWSTEVASKVRDTIAGVIGSAMKNHPSDIIVRCADILGARDSRRIHVIAWIIEDEQPPHPHHKKRKVQIGLKHKRSEQWREALKKRLTWLTAKVKHSNPFEDPRVPGVSVRNLPHADGDHGDTGSDAKDDKDDKAKRASLVNKIRGIETECKQLGLLLEGPIRQGLDALVKQIT